MPLPVFELPDLSTSFTPMSFEFSPAAEGEAAEVLAAGPAAIYQRLLRDQESEAVFLVARRVLGAFLPGGTAPDPARESVVDTETLVARVAAARTEIAAVLDPLASLAPDVRALVLSQRAPVSLVAGCWLDCVSQPRTQPSVIANHLFQHHFRVMGEGTIQRSLHHRRRRALELANVHLPETAAGDFLDRAAARPLAMLHGAFHLALSRLPTSFFPELVGTHYAFHALGFDDRLTGPASLLTEPDLRAVLDEYLELTRRGADGPAERHRLAAAVDLVIRLEREQAGLLADLAAFRTGLSLDARVAEIIARHAPFAGRQHRDVRVAGKPLTDTFDDPNFDLAAFVTEFRASRQLKPMKDGSCRFLNTIRFGGRMFAIFDAAEADILTRWVAAVQAGDRPEVVIPVNRVGDDRAAAWLAAIAGPVPDDVVFAETPAMDDRELLYRLVNIEAFPNTLAVARRRALSGFADGEVLFEHGAAGRYTDASFFEYSADALRARVESIYWEKLLNPYRPLTEIPDREAVVFHQLTMALGNIIESAWSHRLANVGRYHRASDGIMFAIYADEVGRGEVAKNHVTLIHRVMSSMGIQLPHVRDAAFKEQETLPDSHYYFAVHQVCMALFPDTFYPEILGYNLGIEMYGLGEIRMHEIEKLRAHGFDTIYEEAHLSIDNVSTGHSRQSIDALISYLDHVERTRGVAAVREDWRRIWRGYASFAFFTEHQLIGDLNAAEAREEAEVLI